MRTNRSDATAAERARLSAGIEAINRQPCDAKTELLLKKTNRDDGDTGDTSIICLMAQAAEATRRRRADTVREIAEIAK